MVPVLPARAIVLAGIGLLAVFAAPRPAEAQAPDLDKMDIVLKSIPDGPVARVNGVAIPRAEFARLYTLELLRISDLNDGKPIPDGVRVQLGLRTLGNLVQQELLYQEALKNNINISASDVEERWQFQLAQYRQAEPNLTEADVLKGLGLQDREPVLEEIKRMLLVEAIYEQIIKQANIDIPEEEIKKLYEQEKEHMVRPESLHLRQIYIAPGTTPEQKTAARARAEEALKRVHAGQRFEAVVREVSQSPRAQDGGEMGPWPVTEFPPFMIDAAMKLQPQQISPVIESDFGFHIIQLIELKPGRVINYDEARPILRQSLLADQGEEIVNDYCDALLDTTAEVYVYLELEKNLALDPELHQLLLK